MQTYLEEIAYSVPLIMGAAIVVTTTGSILAGYRTDQQLKELTHKGREYLHEVLHPEQEHNKDMNPQVPTDEEIYQKVVEEQK